MQRTNINIKDTYNSFCYLIEYEQTNNIKTSNELRYYLSYVPQTNQNIVSFLDEYSNLIQYSNLWKRETSVGEKSYIPNSELCFCGPISLVQIKQLWVIIEGIFSCCSTSIDINTIKLMWDSVDWESIDENSNLYKCLCKAINDEKLLRWWRNTNENYDGNTYTETPPLIPDECCNEGIDFQIVKDLWYEVTQYYINNSNNNQSKSSTGDLQIDLQGNCGCSAISEEYVLNLWETINSSNFPLDDNEVNCCEPINTIMVQQLWSQISENYYNDIETIPNTDIAHYKTSKLRLYFPQFSVDTYKSGVKYVLNINTWIHGYRVSLGSYLISRLDSLATPVKRMYGHNYYEYVEFDIIDPWDLTYGDRWDMFRKRVCKEIPGTNSVGSVLNFSLYPIIEDDNGDYIMLDGYQGGQNSINISKNIDDYLHLNIYANTNNIGDDWKPNIRCNINFNNSYSNLNEYLKETYNINGEPMIRYELVIKDNNDIYSTVELVSDNCNIDFYDIGINNKDQANLINWSWWEEYHKQMDNNLVIQCIANILIKYDEESDYNDFLYIKSNEIPLTQELFSYFVNDLDIKYVNLNNVDMNLYNINVVNKTENVIYQFDNPSDAKSNIIQPVFFKARDVANIIIHPAVTENICINLDSFKSKVKTFMIQIEGCSFTEIGRTSAGIIFKIIGTKLPNSVTEGVYYILNEGGELITNGKYKYDS